MNRATFGDVIIRASYNLARRGMDWWRLQVQVLTAQYQEATFTARTPRTWFGRGWYRFKRRRSERRFAELQAWLDMILPDAVCDVCGVSVWPVPGHVELEDDPRTHTREVLAIRCKDHTDWYT